jgi:hypothetical protein
MEHHLRSNRESQREETSDKLHILPKSICQGLNVQSRDTQVLFYLLPAHEEKYGQWGAGIIYFLVSGCF